MKKLSVTLVLLTMIAATTVFANNISVSNVTLAGQNISAGANHTNNFTYVQFNLSWQNSWRTSAAPANWDAAWVFVKFRIVGQTTWRHVHIASSGNVPGSGTGHRIQVGKIDESAAYRDTTNPGMGAFIYRSADSAGTFSASGIRLKWFYTRNGVQDNDIVDVDVYAVEMVHVPAGAFWLGNAGSGDPSQWSHFYSFGSTPRASFQVTSNTITAGQATGNLFAGPTNNPAVSAYTGSTFPTGFNGFYCMKYECSQQQYVDFLNSLTSAQFSTAQITGVAATNQRLGISLSGSTFSTTLPTVPVNYVTWNKQAAYLDWAGLRPMTELEFEKACRGTQFPVIDEYAWGTTNLTRLAGYTSAGTVSETPDSANCNSNLNSFSPNGASTGAMRVGACAGASSTREKAGASFYGIMDLTGNLWEQTVGLFGTGISFTPIHGDGVLNATGFATNASWPSYSATTGAVTNGWNWDGSILRGGSWATGSVGSPAGWAAGRPSVGTVTNRQVSYAGMNQAGEERQYGLRGVRSLPTNPAE